MNWQSGGGVRIKVLRTGVSLNEAAEYRNFLIFEYFQDMGNSMIQVKQKPAVTLKAAAEPQGRGKRAKEPKTCNFQTPLEFFQLEM